jgi:hypothetical protein
VQDVKRLVTATFPNRKVASTELMPGGLINTNLKIYFESDFDPVVLRIYRDGAAVCDKELAVHNLIRRHVPVPEILHSESKNRPFCRIYKPIAVLFITILEIETY